MRIIFLDMDGVLNSHAFFNDAGPRPDQDIPEMNEKYEAAYDADKWWLRMIDPFAVWRLNKIVAATAARTVISSSWRYHCDAPKMQDLLKTKGFKGEVIGRTPLSHQLPKSFRGTGLRGTEIQVWLAKNIDLKVADRFVILDDMSEAQFPGLEKHLIRTSWGHGLMDHHVPRAIEILRKE